MSNTCLDYIQKEYDWKLDYKLDNVFNTIEDRNKHINARKDIISNFDAVTSRRFSDINNRYEYTGACVLRDDRKLDFIKRNDACSMKGSILTDKLDPIDGLYGRYIVDDNANVQLTNLNNYKKNNGIGSADTIKPNDGCFLNIDDKDKFYNIVDQLVLMKQFEESDSINKLNVENNKTNEENKKLLDTMKLYGISVPDDMNKYGHSIITKCRDISTDNVNTDDWNYLSLNKLDIACADDEVINRFEINKTNDNSFKVDLRCCSMRSEDNKIGLGNPVQKTTGFIKNNINDMKILTKQNLVCLDPGLDPSTNASMLNYIKLNNNPISDQFAFDYNCSTIEKDITSDTRKIHYDCKPRITKSVNKEFGIRPLTKIFAECPFGEAISQIKIEDDNADNTKYRYNYQCCKPKIIPIDKPTPIKDRIISGSYIQIIQSDLSFNQITSMNGKNKLVMQSDGNLVLYKNGIATWSSNTSIGQGIYKAEITPSGQLIIMNNNGNYIWSTSPADPRKAPFSLVCQDDGNVVIYAQANSTYEPVWSIN
jgi:hypothetical protein